MAGDWRQMIWPMAALPFEVLRELCNKLDCITTLTHSFSLLAAKLGYATEDIELFISRSRGNWAPIPNSPTYLLLMDFTDRRGTIQQVQYALDTLRHVAADIIPQNLGFVSSQVSNHYRRHAIPVSTHPRNSGNQNTEYSLCNCPHCNVHDINMLPAPPNYPSRSYSQPPCYQSPKVGGGNEPRRTSNRGDNSSHIGRQYLADNNHFSPQRTTEVSRNTMMPAHIVRSELHTEHQHRQCMETMCDNCRIRTDPDETVLLTVSNEKHKFCECSARNNHGDERLALTSVFRQSPLGHANPDDPSVSSHSSNSSSNHDNIMSSGTRSRAGSHGNQRNPQLSQTTDTSHGAPCSEVDCPLACGGNTNKSKKVVKMHSTDKDRHSWPSTTSENDVARFMNSSSDFQLSSSRHGNITHQQADLNRIQNTMYGKISLSSNSSDVHNEYHNNLDEDGGNAPDDDAIGQNIRQSNSMNEVEDRLASASSAVLRLNDQVNSGNWTNRQNRKRIFVTYAWNGINDSPGFLDELVHCCQQVKAAGAKVKIDMDESSYHALRLNKLDWIDRNIREANYIFVCITPTYQRDIEESAELEGAPRASQLNTRYVYDQLRSEYFSNNSINYRVIPILFRTFGTTETHVPACMRTTVIYSYPDNINDIIDAVFGRGRYRPA